MFDSQNRLKPVLKWAGGKGGLLSQLVPYFPGDFARFIEPFVGGGAVFLSLAGHVPAVINDANAELMNLYHVIRDAPFELMSALDSMALQYSESYFYEVRKSLPGNDVTRAARTVFLNKTGFNGLYRQNARGEFNVPWGQRETCPALYEQENLLAVSKRLASVLLHSLDFEDVLNMCGEGDFVYCDPPYEPVTATSSFNAYRAGGFSQCEQRRLREACLRAAGRGAAIAISNSCAPFILELYSQERVQFVSARRAINSKGNARGKIQEVLVSLGYNPS